MSSTVCESWYHKFSRVSTKSCVVWPYPVQQSLTSTGHYGTTRVAQYHTTCYLSYRKCVGAQRGSPGRSYAGAVAP
eukprot:2096295-Rhodomonas_salina.2